MGSESPTNQFKRLLRAGAYDGIWGTGLIEKAREENSAFTLKQIKSFRVFLDPGFWKEPNLATEAPSAWNEALKELNALFRLWQEAQSEAKKVVNRFEGYTQQQLIFEWGTYLEFQNARMKSSGTIDIEYLRANKDLEQHSRTLHYGEGINALDYLLKKVLLHTVEDKNPKRAIPKEEFSGHINAIVNLLEVEGVIDGYLWGGISIESVSDNHIKATQAETEYVLRRQRDNLKASYAQAYVHNFVFSAFIIFMQDIQEAGRPLPIFPDFSGYQAADKSVSITKDNISSLLGLLYDQEYLKCLVSILGKRLDPQNKLVIHLEDGREIQIDHILKVFTILGLLSRIHIKYIDDLVESELKDLEKENRKNPSYRLDSLKVHLARKNPEMLQKAFEEMYKHPETLEQLAWSAQTLEKHFDYEKCLVKVPAKVLARGIAQALNIPKQDVFDALTLITANLDLIEGKDMRTLSKFPLMLSPEDLTYYWFPGTMAFWNHADTFLHYLLENRSLFKLDSIQSPLFEESTRDLFRKAGFNVLPEHKYKGISQGDIDLLAHKDGIFFLGELKITEPVGKLGKELSWKRNQLIKKGEKQLPKNLKYILDHWELVSSKMGLKNHPKPKQEDFFPFLFSNSFLFDGDPDLPYLKISILELQILLAKGQEQFLHEFAEYWKLRIKHATEAGIKVPPQILAWQKGEILLDKLPQNENKDLQERIQLFVHYLDHEGLPFRTGELISGEDLKSFLETNRVWAFMDDLPMRQTTAKYQIGKLVMESGVSVF